MRRHLLKVPTRTRRRSARWSRGKLDTPMAVRYGRPCGLRKTPDIEHPCGRMRVGASFGERNATVGDDRAIPMSATCCEVDDLVARCRIIDVERATGVV